MDELIEVQEPVWMIEVQELGETVGGQGLVEMIEFLELVEMIGVLELVEMLQRTIEEQELDEIVEVLDAFQGQGRMAV